MDTSKEYIKMCEKADEIQKKWVLWKDKKLGTVKKGDFFYDKLLESVRVIMEPILLVKGVAENSIWLPRQDQLQGMMKYNDRKMGSLHNLINFATTMRIGTKNRGSYYFEFNSMEQLWLAFVMKEKFNKVWDGKEWRE